MKFTQIKYFINKINSKKEESSVLKFTSKAAFFSITLGTFALIISLSILDGFEDMLTESTTKFTSDISIVNIKNGFVTKDSVNLTGMGNIKKITEVVEKPVIMRKKKDIDGFVLKGINRNSDLELFDSNYPFSSDSSKEIVVSKVIQKKYDLNIDDELVLYAVEYNQKSSPKTKISKFKIVGTYSTGLGEYDKSIIFSPLVTSKDFFDIPDEYSTRLEISVLDKNKINETTNKVAELIPFPFMVKNVFDYQRSALIWIQVQKEPVPLVLGIISIVATLNVVTMLLIMIVEKTKQIGILKILGMSSKDISKIFISIGVLLTAKAAIAGALLAFILSFLQQEYGLIHLDSSVYYLDKVPITINPIHYVIVVANAILISLIVVSIPAIISSKFNPLRILRFS
ncbi:MAG: ABC transporter permease [Chlorobiota bacterium]